MKTGAAIAAALAFTWTTARAQPDPTAAAIRSGYAVMHNRLGLMEYCASKGYVPADAVARTNASVADADSAADFNELLGVKKSELSPTARPSEDLGRRGQVLGPQTVGLADLNNPAHPETVRDRQVMSLGQNAAAQKSSESALCRQMAAQVAPLR